MKCAACNYEYELNSWDEGYKKDDDFIYLSMSNEIKLISQSSAMWEDPKTHNLYACPKCGTLKIQVW